MRSIRLARLVAGLVLAAATATAADAVTPYGTARAPQVPISSIVWGTLFAAHQESIDIHTQQCATQLWDFGPISPDAPPKLSIELPVRSDSVSVGMYGVEYGTPTKIELFSSAGPRGGYVLVSFRAGDVADVYSFDEIGILHGMTRLSGISSRRVGFYAQWPSSVAHGEDARNPEARPQVLSFASVVYPGSEWLGFEPRPNDGTSPRGFDDAILTVEKLMPGLPALTKTWGRVKTGGR